jgi:glycosyltransferase involved in cell wall biosynthesis
MRIGFLGCRGIPRCYSGFETFVEELAVRLVQRGHEVTVYNRIPFNPYREKTFRGVRIVQVPTIPTKATDTIVHTALSLVHALTQRFDVLYITGVGNALFACLPRWFGTTTLVNVDGADWARAKWSGFGRWWLRQSEGVAARSADALIADHPCIADRYREQFRIEAKVIPYGAEVVTADPGQDWLKQLNLESKKYLLYVSRLTPENGADVIMQAYLDSGVELPLVVVGDAPYQAEFKAKLAKMVATSQGRIRMPGFVFGNGYRQLSFHARAYLYPTAIDATRPVILEQMGFGAAIISRDTAANRHILGKAALYYDAAQAPNSLAEKIRLAGNEPELLQDLGRQAQQRIREHYDWEKITTDYEELFRKLHG